MVGVWWIGFSMIPFRLLPENVFDKKPTGNVWTNGYMEIVKVWRSLKELPDLKRYLVAYLLLQFRCSDGNVSGGTVRY